LLKFYNKEGKKMYQNKKQLQFIWIFKPELTDVAKRVAEDHVKWMNATHTKEGEKALIVLNWSIGPEFKEGAETGNMALVLTEIYENQEGIDDHFKQAQNNESYFRDDLDEFSKNCEQRVTIHSSDVIQSM
jgi:hypothetical protein